MLPEYVGSLNDCQQAVDACSEVGLPVFLGIKDVGRYMEDPKSIVRGLKGRRVDVILAMCTQPEIISERLPTLRKTFGGVIGLYADIEYTETSKVTGDPNQQMREIKWGDNSPEKYVACYLWKNGLIWEHR